MLNFLIKDWYSNRLMVYTFLGLIAADTALTMIEPTPPTLAVVFLSILAAALPITFLAREEKFRSVPLTCSLPLTRKTINRYRYLSAWTYGLGAEICVVLMVALGLAVQSAPRGPVTPKTLLIGLTTLAVILAFFLPVVIRFGMKGLLIPLVFLQVLGVIAMIVASATSHPVSISSLILPVRTGLETFYAEVGAPLYYLTWVALLVILNLLSCRVSRWVFEHQEF